MDALPELPQELPASSNAVPALRRVLHASIELRRDRVVIEIDYRVIGHNMDTIRADKDEHECEKKCNESLTQT
jgi:hypothetical protein